MMSEKQIFKWKEDAKKAFEEVKKAIAHARTLINPDFKKSFIIYCNASEHTMSSILLQKNELGEEVPIVFMSIPLKKHELNYSLNEKRAFAVVKFVKHFRYYILDSHSVVFVPNSAVKRKPQLAALPLRPVVVEEPFKKWGLDFIGPLTPSSSAGHTHILTATDYFTKWVEAVPIRRTTSEIICEFLKENISVRFGVPLKIVTDNAASFSSTEISMFCYDHGISLAHSSDYYPQASKLQTVIEDSHFQNALERRIMHLARLEEEREKLVDHITEHQQWVK
ncbi:uncharacterized protein LOC131048779 [Cryptomeria japonica]|uniref:uncharacterized protein LOC131048779 n=1 Tax=Cryptomeria japonica TaxID=3369 RepID=UPI0025ACEFA6|nr:uncharacterized protein LOC131048779 [Cryptomeria japonica]